VKFIQTLLCCVLGFAATHAAACFTVYDRADRVVYQSQTPPVDMSRPLHETLPARFPGGHMIFELGAECPVISSVASGRGERSVWTSSPLLTDTRTARAMRLPHTVMADGVALVRQRDAVMMPGFTVLPSTAVATVPPTAVMGAPARGSVITELRDPPVTIIEQPSGRVTLREPSR
jgi:hypothetical protein